jgi:hypothetical protein
MTWEISNLPTDQKAIGLKWVFKVKRDPVGNIVKHKTRLVDHMVVKLAFLNGDLLEEVYVHQPQVSLILALQERC